MQAKELWSHCRRYARLKGLWWIGRVQILSDGMQVLPQKRSTPVDWARRAGVQIELGEPTELA
jgi:hypothetical protein